MGWDLVLGTEVEYGITITNDQNFNPVATSGAVVNAYRDGADRISWSFESEYPTRDARSSSLTEVRSSVSDSGLINAVLRNGARLYVDHAHPEYSTSECSDPLEATLYDKAGELIMHSAAERVNRTLREGRRLLIHKNNSDRKGNSYGAHENYLVPRSLPFREIVDQMTAFFVSRQILTGSGKVGAEHGREDASYQITQRADFFEEEVGLETTMNRPIINTRDEPHADPDEYRRLHVIFGDATMSEVQTFVKLGSTSLMLMALSDGALDEPLLLEDPLSDLLRVSRDISCRAELTLTSGVRRTALELQQHYVTILEGYVRSRTLPSLYEDVVREWRSLLDDLSEGYHAVADRLDWAGKLSILEAYRERDGLDWSDPKLALIDLQYHDVDPSRGLYHRLISSGSMRRLFDTDDVRRAVLKPPTSTRAWFRGECLRRYPDDVVSANWDSLVFDVGGEKLVRVPMMEPLRGTKDLVDKLFRESPDAATLILNLGGSDD